MYSELLKEWCDALIELQVTQIKRKEIYGGIMCPSCARIHGRCADAIYPMMFLADKTGEDKYLKCAKLLFQWAENMSRPGGSYNNDTNSEWKGITVFTVIQLGEALHYHGHILDDGTRELWTKRLRMGADFLFHSIDRIGGNINYPITCSGAMAIAGLVLEEEKYSRKGRELANTALTYFTSEHLIYGEGKPNDAITSKGCYPVDIGYNVEESLPGLLLYAMIEGDDVVYDRVLQSMEAHLEFMLPDGGWDNSFGTRNNKWSYWGSRTSDGCQAAYGILGDKNSVFAEAAFRNTKLLKACTHNGLLHGGPMYHTAGEPPCVHHTFCHGKALAAMLEGDHRPQHSCKLPREFEKGVQYYPSMDVYLLSKGTWRATVSGYDFEYSEGGHASGGAITALWNERIGMVLAGTMTKYYLVEPNNMQIPVHTNEICLTPRIEYEQDGIYYRSINDTNAAITADENDTAIVVKVNGRLVDFKQYSLMNYELEYVINQNVFHITGRVNHVGSSQRGTETDRSKLRYILPIISRTGEEIQNINENTVKIQKDQAELTIDSSHVLKYSNIYPKKTALTLEESSVQEEIHRIFHPVGGFEAIPLYIDIELDIDFKFTIQL